MIISTPIRAHQLTKIWSNQKNEANKTRMDTKKITRLAQCTLQHAMQFKQFKARLVVQPLEIQPLWVDRLPQVQPKENTVAISTQFAQFLPHFASFTQILPPNSSTRHLAPKNKPRKKPRKKHGHKHRYNLGHKKEGPN